MDKVTIFGAGHVGATAAFYIALSASVQVSLIDIAEGKAKGLAMDIEQSLPYTGSSSRLDGSTDPRAVEGSDLVVVTAGFPRLPGMSRLDLVSKNLSIISEIASSVASYAPDAVVLVVTNPVDEMTWLTWHKSGLDSAKVLGMAGVLDTSRMMYCLDRMAGLSPSGMNAMVLGTHGDDMVPLVDWSRSDGTPLSDVVPADLLEDVVSRTQDGGAEIVGYLKTGSAYYAPAVSVGVTALAILGDTGRVLPVSAYMNGEYGIDGIFFGVPAKLTRKGVSEIVVLPLSEQEKRALTDSATGVKSRIAELQTVIGNESN